MPIVGRSRKSLDADDCSIGSCSAAPASASWKRTSAPGQSEKFSETLTASKMESSRSCNFMHPMYLPLGKSSFQVTTSTSWSSCKQGNGSAGFHGTLISGNLPLIGRKTKPFKLRTIFERKHTTLRCLGAPSSFAHTIFPYKAHRLVSSDFHWLDVPVFSPSCAAFAMEMRTQHLSLWKARFRFSRPMTCTRRPSNDFGPRSTTTSPLLRLPRKSLPEPQWKTPHTILPLTSLSFSMGLCFCISASSSFSSSYS
mmetsp:Transcript_45234/g.130610  ORF Transcript_45234/g.130610 Transcript_45234/m.130610 type:complete len:254 (-) Transcript_45234:366-1127(-)